MAPLELGPQWYPCCKSSLTYESAQVQKEVSDLLGAPSVSLVHLHAATTTCGCGQATLWWCYICWHNKLIRLKDCPHLACIVQKPSSWTEQPHRRFGPPILKCVGSPTCPCIHLAQNGPLRSSDQLPWLVTEWGLCREGGGHAKVLCWVPPLLGPTPLQIWSEVNLK